MRVCKVCEGILTKPGIAEKTWVMPKEASRAGFSASAKSQRYSLGIISEGLTDGAWCECEVGCGADDAGVLGGTETDPPLLHGEMGDAGNIDGFLG